MNRKKMFRSLLAVLPAAAFSLLLAGCGDELLSYAPENADFVVVLNGSRMAAQPQVHQMVSFLTMTAPGFDGRLDRELARAGVNANDFKNEYMLFYSIAQKSGGGAAVTPTGVAPKLFRAFSQIYKKSAREITINHLPGFEVRLPDNQGFLRCVLNSDHRLELAWGKAPQLPLSGGHRNYLAQRLDTQSSLIHFRIAPAALFQRSAEKIPPFLTKLDVFSFQLRNQNGMLTQQVRLEFPAMEYAYEAKGAAETLISSFNALLPFKLPLRLDQTQLSVEGSTLAFSGQFAKNRFFAASPRPSRRPVTSAANLKLLAAACSLYAQENAGVWPSSLDHLRSNGQLVDPAILIAPNDLSTTQAPPDGPFLPENSSYIYLAGDLPAGAISSDDARHYPAAIEKSEFQPMAESAILWLDGSVSYLRLETSDPAAIVKQLRQQQHGEEKYWKHLEANAAAFSPDSI